MSWITVADSIALATLDNNITACAASPSGANAFGPRITTGLAPRPTIHPPSPRVPLPPHLARTT